MKSQVLFSSNTINYIKIAVSESVEIASTEDLGRYLSVPSITRKVTKGMC